MTATTTERLTPGAGTAPSRGTIPIAADTLIRKGWLVGLDVNGLAVAGDTIANGCLVGVGVASATVDNRTGSELGGAAGAADVEVEYGVFGFASKTGGGDDIAAVSVGEPCFVVDNQTVALTNGTDTRGIAGFISEVRAGVVFVYMGPHVAGMIVIAASEDSQLDTAQTDIAALQVDAETANYVIPIPLASFVAADATPLAKFASAGTPTFGLNLADSESLNVRWNNDANPGTALCAVNLPDDLDETADFDLEFLVSKSGATVGDATVLTVAAFIIKPGDLHDADTNCGGDTGALVGDATAKTTALLTRTIALADIPAGTSRRMTFTVTPKAGTLGTDDLMLHSAKIRGTRKLLAA